MTDVLLVCSRVVQPQRLSVDTVAGDSICKQTFNMRWHFYKTVCSFNPRQFIFKSNRPFHAASLEEMIHIVVKSSSLAAKFSHFLPLRSKVIFILHL